VLQLSANNGFFLFIFFALVISEKPKQHHPALNNTRAVQVHFTGKQFKMWKSGVAQYPAQGLYRSVIRALW
jgi:hypothetical protein